MIYFYFLNFFILNNSYSLVYKKIISLNFIFFGIINFRMLIILSSILTFFFLVTLIQYFVFLVLSLRI